jgi:hypothetical protein
LIDKNVPCLNTYSLTINSEMNGSSSASFHLPQQQPVVAPEFLAVQQQQQQSDSPGKAGTDSLLLPNGAEGGGGGGQLQVILTVRMLMQGKVRSEGGKGGDKIIPCCWAGSGQHHRQEGRLRPADSGTKRRKS